jgi:hypothetical protein
VPGGHRDVPRQLRRPHARQSGVFVALRSSSKFHADNFSLARSRMIAGGLADLVRIWWAIAVSGRSTITVFDFFWYRYIGQAKSLTILKI